MSGRIIRRGAAVVAVVAALISTALAQAPGDFATEPDKTMATAHESFVKGDMNKAADQIHAAAVYVKKEGDKVAKGSREAVRKAGDSLEGLSQQVKKGAVKSGDQLKKTFAQVDHQLATAWHTTAGEARKAGQNATPALKNAGAALAGAAQWSGAQLNAGAQASVDGVKKVGQGVTLGAEEVGKFFTGIGEGVADVGRRLGGS